MLGNKLDKYFNFRIVEKEKLRNELKINISLSLSFYQYCLDPVDLIDQIIQSKVQTISIRSIHDIVPTIIKSNKYFSKLKMLKFIKCSRKDNMLKQMLEVNYVLYNKYFPFHKEYISSGKTILKLFKTKQKIGVHARLNDKCLEKCSISINTIFKICNITNKLCNNCVIMLSSFSRNFTKSFMQYNSNVYVYNSNYNIKHSSKSPNFNQLDIQKTILDIYLTSNSDIILLSGDSTFSLLILYKGYYKNYKRCLSKYYTFWDNNEFYDHISSYRRKKNCKIISLLK